MSPISWPISIVSSDPYVSDLTPMYPTMLSARPLFTMLRHGAFLLRLQQALPAYRVSIVSSDPFFLAADSPASHNTGTASTIAAPHRVAAAYSASSHNASAAATLSAPYPAATSLVRPA